MSKNGKGSVFFNGLRQVIIVIIMMLIVGFLSYQAVFWYFKQGNQLGLKKTAIKNKDVVYTAMILDSDGEQDNEGIIVRAIHPKTNNVDMLVIPENTVISASSKTYATLKEKGTILQEPMTIGDIATLVSSKTEQYELQVQALEELLGIEQISYYEAYDKSAFITIANLVPAQTMTVPMTIGNDSGVLLEQGEQSLNGEQAYAVVSFGGYPNGTLDQGKLLAQFFHGYYCAFSQMTEEEKEQAYATYNKTVTTNESEKEQEQLKEYIEKATKEQFHIAMIPGIENAGTYELTTEQVSQTIKQIKENETAYTTEQDMSQFQVESVSSSKDLVTKVYNGTRIEGLATEWVQTLRADGYNVIGAANDTGEQKQKTIIYVKTEGTGLDLKAYFQGADVVVDSSLEGIDIKIVLGLDQAHS